MRRREIAREEWQEFFDSFSGQHEGWLVGVDRFDEFLDESVETRHLDGALRGLQSDDGAVALAVDDRSTGHLETESITIPSALCWSSRKTKSTQRSRSTGRSRASSCDSTTRWRPKWSTALRVRTRDDRV